MKANEIKKGLVIDQDNKKILIKKVFVQSPSSRSGSTLYKVTGSDISSGQKFERRYKGDEVITPVDISRCSVQLLFHDNDSYTFMDSENYNQFILAADAVEDAMDDAADAAEDSAGEAQEAAEEAAAEAEEAAGEAQEAADEAAEKAQDAAAEADAAMQK